MRGTEVEDEEVARRKGEKGMMRRRIRMMS